MMGTSGVLVADGVAVAVGGRGVRVGRGVDVRVAVAVLVAVGVFEGVTVTVVVAVSVGVDDGVGVFVGVEVAVLVAVFGGVSVGVGVFVGVALGVRVGSCASVGITTSCASGWQPAIKRTTITSAIACFALIIMALSSDPGSHLTLRPPLRYAIIIILICVAACQPVASADELAVVQPETRLPPATARATQVRSVATRAPTETATFDPIPPTAPPPATVEPELLTQVALPLATTTLPGDTTLIGRSAGGRGILARRFGSGGRLLVIVGGIHGGWEANTVTLVNMLIAHYAQNPQDVPSGVALALIPIANPDGLPYGREAQGRFNDHGVDLNRNWGCGWQEDAVWRSSRVNAGPYAFSEPETSALADFIQAARPYAVLFYHSAAGGVFSGSCAESPVGTDGAATSDRLAAIYGESAGYQYGTEFDAYPVTGTAPSWIVGLGIASADVELQTWTDPEFDRNLRALSALMTWMAQGN